MSATTSVDSYSASALALVQNLIDQLSLRDAPPANDVVFAQDKTQEEDHQPATISPTLETFSFDTDHSNDKRSLNVMSPTDSKATPASRLGHDSLISFCQATLSHIQGESFSSVPLHIETPIMTQQQDNNKLSSSLNLSPMKRFWTRHKKHSQLPPRPHRPTGTTPRVQQFGSEYARHLSSSVLAPELRQYRAVRKHTKQAAEKTQDLRNASERIQTGAVLDIVATVGTNTKGLTKRYHRILTLDREKSRAKISVFVKKEANWDKACQRPCITAVCCIFPDRYEFVPPGFCLVRSPTNEMVNVGTEKERMYLCFRRSREGNPLTGLTPLQPPEAVPMGYTVLEKTPRNYCANLNSGLSLPPVFLAMRQRLCNLETLRPWPLLRTVQSDAENNEISDDANAVAASKKVICRLHAYFCTGGTTVAAKVGLLHIMDRSTHTLLSPSSVENRLAILEMSRRKLKDESNTIPTADTNEELTTLDGDQPEENKLHCDMCGSDASTTDNKSVSFRVRKDSNASDCYRTDHSSVASDEAHSASLMGRSRVSSFQCSTAGRSTATPSSRQRRNLSYSAMSFIPLVETAASDDGAKKRLSGRQILLAPVLTVCYTRHGGAALAAMEGLTQLLTQTDFFADDVTDEFSDAAATESSTRLTLLDLAVQTVCDVATVGAQETNFPACVEFVEKAVKYTQSKLNTRTIGYVVRFYLYVFYFGASVPTSSPLWPSPSWRCRNDTDGGESDTDILYDPRSIANSYLPGGAPQLAALGLKELISLSIVRLGQVSVTDMVTLARSASTNDDSPFDAGLNEDGRPKYLQPFVDSLLKGVVDSAVDHVERATFVQHALHQVQRSGGSELFWHDMVSSVGMGLFSKDEKMVEAGRDIYTMIFAMLANLVKVAAAKTKQANMATELTPRDVASKQLSLELLLHFLEYWNDEQEAMKSLESRKAPGPNQSVETLTYCIRRLVVPCLLSNTKCGLDNPTIFRRILRIVTELWTSSTYRECFKMELGVLIDQFVVRLLQNGPDLSLVREVNLNGQAILPFAVQQLHTMREIKSWYTRHPFSYIEMFANWDIDFLTRPGSMSLLPTTHSRLTERMCDGLSLIAEQCGELIAHEIAESRSIISNACSSMTKSAKAHNDQSGGKSAHPEARLLRKAALDTILQIVKSLVLAASQMLEPEFAALVQSWSPVDGSEWCVSGLPIMPAGGNESASKSEPSTEQDMTLSWLSAMNTYSVDKPITQEPQVAFHIAETKSLKKAVEYLIACNIITPSPRDVATFLRLHVEKWDPTALGNYLGECGIGSTEIEYWSCVRHMYIRAMTFVSLNVEEGLRHFLAEAGFRLPQEAQKIDRIIYTFAKCYFEDNAGDTTRCPLQTEDGVYILSFAILMLNTDLHKVASCKDKLSKKMSKTDFVSNLNAAELEENIPPDYVCAIYDSVHDNPISLHEAIPVNDTSRRAVIDMLTNVRNSESLLRGVAVHDFKQTSMQHLRNATVGNSLALKTIEMCVLRMWHQWHGVINTGLETAHLDLDGMRLSVEILLYSLSLSIILGMPRQTCAFLDQLGRLKSFEDCRQGQKLKTSDRCFREERWFLDLAKACSHTEQSKIWALREVRQWLETLHSALLVDAQNNKAMREATCGIHEGDFLMLDPARSFIRSGDLTKKSGRTGRTTGYRFYLFSDLLMYARKDAGGQFSIHEELPLHFLKIVDWFPPAQKNRLYVFDIHHPRKKFQVICSSFDERKIWVKDIREAISLDVERKMTLEAARTAAHTPSK